MLPGSSGALTFNGHGRRARLPDAPCEYTSARIITAVKQTVHAACPHDCPDACGVLITVEEGRATRIQGDPAHPVTRGFLCAKVAKYLDRVYSPDRVLYPMRRVGPKGPEKLRSFAPG